MYRENRESYMSRLKRESQTYLANRTPVILKLDGKQFKIFTKHLNKPFDNIIAITMQDTMRYLCEHITNCVLGYTQSDEIILVLCDYKKPTSQSWLNNNTQKICSAAASMASMIFNKLFNENIDELNDQTYGNCDPKLMQLILNYDACAEHGAIFDCCAFNVPKHDVNDCLIWRQTDAINASIRAVAQSEFSNKRLTDKTEKQMLEMLRKERNIDWSEYPEHLKYGSCCIQTEELFTKPNGEKCTRQSWIIDSKIPLFEENTSYVNDRINFD